MNANGIGSTQFADACRIPRPTLSQILSGRNKKISDEVISKIHEAYPQLSVLWLLFGEGEMLARVVTPNVEPQNGHSTPGQSYDSSFRTAAAAPSSRLEDEEPGLFGGDELIFGDEMGSEKPEADVSVTRTEESGSPTVQIPADGSKSIVNIMVFYSDNSYQSFVPR